MDAWLTDEIKELLFTPCLSVSASVGRRLDNRQKMGQEIDERALTEFLVDSIDTSSSENVWGNVIGVLRDHNIYLSTHVDKSRKESATGADVGFIIHRSIHQSDSSSEAHYAALVQCKRIDSDGNISDFFHQVGGRGPKQSTLMLDITPNSFYFIYTPPSLLRTYCSIEPIGFAQARLGCSSAVWNFGSFGFDHKSLSFLSAREKAEAVGILVLPALAVEAQRSSRRSADLASILPNCLPLWYWFGELLIPGFIGDRRSDVVTIASNASGQKNLEAFRFDVKYSVSIKLGSG
jgi:hypothetical protein